MSPYIRLLVVVLCGGLFSILSARHSLAGETATLHEWTTVESATSAQATADVLPDESGSGSVNLEATTINGRLRGFIDVLFYDTSGLYTVSAVTISSGSTVVLGGLTVVQTYVRRHPGPTYGFSQFGGRKVPFPAGFNPFDVATVLISDSNSNVVFSQALNPVPNGFYSAVSTFAPGATAPGARGYALIRAFGPPPPESQPPDPPAPGGGSEGWFGGGAEDWITQGVSYSAAGLTFSAGTVTVNGGATILTGSGLVTTPVTFEPGTVTVNGSNPYAEATTLTGSGVIETSGTAICTGSLALSDSGAPVVTVTLPLAFNPGALSLGGSGGAPTYSVPFPPFEALGGGMLFATESGTVLLSDGSTLSLAPSGTPVVTGTAPPEIILGNALVLGPSGATVRIGNGPPQLVESGTAVLFNGETLLLSSSGATILTGSATEPPATATATTDSESLPEPTPAATPSPGPHVALATTPVTGYIVIRAAGLPASTTLTYAADGNDLGTATTDARGRLKINAVQGGDGTLPSTLDLYSVLSITVHDSDGNILLSAGF